MARWTLKQVQGDGANSIFTGDKLLTAPNAGDDADGAMFARLGLTAMQGEEPLRQAQGKLRGYKARPAETLKI